MNINTGKLQKMLCDKLCGEVKIIPRENGLLLLETPYYFPDGDPYQLYLQELHAGTLRLGDMGHTLMHLSYENEIDKFMQGTRWELFEKILSETDVHLKDGMIYVDTTPENMARDIFRLGQALTRFYDLTFLNRIRVQATFYEDLKEELYLHIPEEKIYPDYIYEGIESAHDYPIDYYIEGKYDPLFVFGIPNKDKARLTTIFLERLLRAKATFESILIFEDQKSIPRADLSRLSNAGGEMISSLDAKDDLQRKLLKRVANGMGN